VIIEYPVPYRADQKGVLDSAPPAPGHFPIVVVAHGANSSGAVMAALTSPWVQAGYVVAAPTFPRTSGPGADVADLPHQPADLHFVITSLVRLFTSATSPLRGHAAVRCIGVAGHSAGAVTVLSSAFESTLRDPRISAVISMSGALVPLAGGTFANPGRVPLLLVHGDRDLAVPISSSRNAFRDLSGPRLFLAFGGADHNSIFVPPVGPVMNFASIAFLDATLKGDGRAWSRLRSTVDGARNATLREASTPLGAGGT
jgi:predicted dienelactone hydrolase